MRHGLRHERGHGLDDAGDAGQPDGNASHVTGFFCTDATVTPCRPCPPHRSPASHCRILPGLNLYPVCADLLTPADCAVRINASATEHHSAWWRCAFGAAITEALSQGSRPLGLQLLHFVPIVKFAVIFYEVLFFLNFPERMPMRQNARQSISTDKPTTRACVKFRPLSLTHFGYPPQKFLTT
jgi:hypothetical protein